MDLTIRIADTADAGMITELYNSDMYLFGEEETGYEEADILEYISDPRKKMFVSIYEGKLAGALLAEYHDTYVYLDTIIVKEGFQGKGVGKKLMETLEADVREQKIPLIESLTEIRNQRMQRFFESRNYKKGNTFIFYSKTLTEREGE